ncbi:PspC domain-containing protein [Nocardioides abyssi]|uniref:PspC domain-containing protein n=1 Tax=Nocardioides abyssi TaxID=3058370 RepID=A0ABT8EWB5_9ACTN|nr:PspC domain-containing protein [Nocardioides abyssi]MDN4162407.1 PspC domain-containing protein [Nocardioides abyssi]
MTTTPSDAPPQPGPEPGPQPGPQDGTGPRTTREEVRDLGRLRRSTTDRKVAGVAGGLARHLDVDPIILRVALVVLVFFGGAGLIVYGAVWLLVPQDDAVEAPFHLDDRTRTVALTIVGVVALLSMLGDSWGVFDFPWPLAVVALLALVLLDRSDRSKRRAATTAATAATAPPGTPGTWPAAPGTWPTAPPAAPAPTAAYGPQLPFAEQQTAPVGAWTAPPVPPAPPAPRNPRRRGPVLFWFTLALCALGIGVLGLLDQGGAPIPDSAYSAIVVAVCGVMLVLGAFWGRAGGLIAVGLVAALGTATTVVTESVDGGRSTYLPASAAGVMSSYQSGTGELVLDLTEVTDLADLDGRTVLVENGIGRIEVLVPAGLDVETEASVGVGDVRVFGTDQGGLGVETTYFYDAPGVDNPTLTIDAHLGIGQVEVRNEGAE